MAGESLVELGRRAAERLAEYTRKTGRLAALEAGDVARRGLRRLVLLVVGAIALWTAVLLLLAGFSLLVAEWMGAGPWAGLLAVGGGLAALSALAVAVAVRRLKEESLRFPITRREIQSDLNRFRNGGR